MRCGRWLHVSSNEIRRNMPLFSMGSVMKLTDLSARQIRYYEQHGLISPERTKGNQRLFSFNDVERLLEIKSLIEKGINLAGIKQMRGAGGENRPADPGNDAGSPDGASGTRAGRKAGSAASAGDGLAADDGRLTERELAELRKKIRMQIMERSKRPFLMNRGELAQFFGDSILKK